VHFAKFFQCKECGLTYELDEVLNRCRVCDGSLDILLDYEKIKKEIRREFFAKKIWHWKYWMFYPVSVENKITLNEGGTPLVKSEHFGKAFDELHFKLESLNPTGSFKDRGSTIEITRALELNIDKICCASTGNMGASVSAYCAKAGIECTIFLPKNTSKQKIKQIKVYGAEIVKVRGSFTSALKTCEKFSESKNVYMVGDFPFRGEGEKSIGFEVADQLNFNPPDWIVCPMGNGTLIYSIYDAFRDFWKVGLISKIPKLCGVQSSGCDPIVRAFEKNLDYIPGIRKSKTLASAIDVPNPIDGIKALEAIRRTRGFACRIPDKEIIKMQKELTIREGIFAELAGVISVAAAMKFKEELKGRVVCIISGAGWKDF
jgi:threonine synthase